MLSELFDEAGDPDSAQRLDDATLAEGWAPLFHGATLETLRSARRAATRGDHAAARRYAQQVIDAWGSADVEVPAVAEMRALLAKLPPAAPPPAAATRPAR